MERDLAEEDYNRSHFLTGCMGCGEIVNECTCGISPEELAFHEAEQARGELAYSPNEMECYECRGFNGVDFDMRRVVKLGRVVNSADPTQTYILECGHVAF